MNKKIVFLALLFAGTMSVKADLLSDILNGEYNAETLSQTEKDSILGKESSGRWKLEYENKQMLFRHSFVADYYIVDTEKGTRKLLSDGPVRDAVMSPNGRYIAFAKGNNLYLHKLDFGTEVAVTNDVNPQIINGIGDWLYEEEFGVTCLFAFSPDSKQLAFVRLDETDVPTYMWQNFLDNKYLSLDSLRYPKAGDKNAKAAICVYDLQNKGIRTLRTHETNEDIYLPRLRWTNETTTGYGVNGSAELVVMKVNRDQNKEELILCNSRSTVTHPLLKEESRDYFVNYELFDQWQWLSDNRIVVLSEQNGWQSLYLYSAQGIKQRQLTPDGIDVTAVYGVDEKNQNVYYQAATTPQTRQCYVINLRSGKIIQLTQKEGIHNMCFSSDYSSVLDDYQSTTTPNLYTLYSLSRDGQLKNAKVVKDNNAVVAKWSELNIPEEEFFSFKTERGDELNAWRIMPKIFDKSKKYPVLMLHYSGPASQRVLDRWRKRWEYYLADQGYVVVCVDVRGTDARGRKWRNASYMQLGRVEAQDLISTASFVKTWPFVDGARIALCGWSYGGYQTIRTMCEPGSPFACGIAIAPVTDWRLYDTAYTERYMRRPQVNEGGYNNADLTTMADRLNGRLLIVHGMSDDNVHAQNTMKMVDALVEANKQFDMQVYPDDNHFLRKRNNYDHLHRKLMEFLTREIGTTK